MSHTEAWQKVFQLSQGNTWVKIPENLSKILGLDSRLGILGGMLCTYTGAQSSIRAIERINNKQES